MVSQGLTEAALRQWNAKSKTNTHNTRSKSKDPPGELLCDPSSDVIEKPHHTRDDHDDCLFARGSSSEESLAEESLAEGAGDDEDDGLYIGANVSVDHVVNIDDSDDSTIAFSDIVLPTEDQDPFLIELAQAAVQEAVDQVELEHAAHSTPVVKEHPTEHPTPVVEPEEQEHSAHVIVAHAVHQRKQEILNMSQEELLEQLEKRLRPYMMTVPKLPPLRRRKRPNCLFVNHMGTRRPQPPAAVLKKRKLAAAAAAARKKRALRPAVVKPNTITAPSSPASCKKKTIIDALPEPMLGTATLLPKLLTDSAWEDDLNDAPVVGVSSPPLKAFLNRKTEEENKATTTQKENAKKRVKVCPPEGENLKRKVDAPTAEEKAVDNVNETNSCSTPEPEVQEKTSKATSSKDPPTSDPPGTTAAIVTPYKTKQTLSEDALSSSQELAPLALDNATVQSLYDEPLPPSFENSYQEFNNHESLASLLNDDSNQTHHQEDQEDPFHLPPTHTPEGQSPERPLRMQRAVPPEVLIPLHGDLPRGLRDAPTCPPRTPTGRPRSYSRVEHNRGSHLHPDCRYSMPRAMLLSPEMDMLSPSTRFGSHSRYEVPLDDLSPASPTFTSPSQRQHLRAIPVRMTTPKMPAYVATPDPHLLPLASMNYRGRRPSLSYGMGPSFHDWEPTQAPSSPTASFVTPVDHALGSPAMRKKVVDALHNNDWMMETNLPPCPPLVGGAHPHHVYHRPAANFYADAQKEPATSSKTKKTKAPRKTKKVLPKAANNASKTTKTKKAATTKVAKKVPAFPKKTPKTGSLKPVSPVQSAAPPKTIDYSRFRKVMSLRSGRTVDPCPMEDKGLAKLDLPVVTTTKAA